MAGKRRPFNSKRNKKSFSRNAVKTHRRNIPSRPMRGGIRL